MQALSEHFDLIKPIETDQHLEQAWTAPVFTFSASHDFVTKPKQGEGSDSPQYALLGGTADFFKEFESKPTQPINQPQDPRIFANISHPCSIFICGSQGSGKSHTLSCLLENYLIPSKVNNLRSPLTGLVFHHDTFISDDGGSPCEAAFLSSSPEVSVTVLCSPTNVTTIKRTYSNLNVMVKPLRIQESDLNTKRMLDLMAVRKEEGAAPLYIQTVMRILREMRIDQQNTGKPFRYQQFKERLSLAGLTPQQLAPLQQRLDTLESFMEQKQLFQKKNKKIVPEEDGGMSWLSKPGALTIVDLSCPCIPSEVACSIFNICLSIFLEQDPHVGRVVALDEAHKYMDSSLEASAFTESLLSTIRLQRHLGVRVIISTQEPTISPKLLDLSSLTIVHRFTSPQWLSVLQRHIAPVASNMRTNDSAEKAGEIHDDDAANIETQASFKHIFEDIVHLGVGQALLFCPSALIAATKNKPSSARPTRLGFGYLKVQIRSRITTDGGKSILAL